jgi:hypothetical protein
MKGNIDNWVCWWCRCCSSFIVLFCVFVSLCVLCPSLHVSLESLFLISTSDLAIVYLTLTHYYIISMNIYLDAYTWPDSIRKYWQYVLGNVKMTVNLSYIDWSDGLTSINEWTLNSLFLRIPILWRHEHVVYYNN